MAQEQVSTLALSHRQRRFYLTCDPIILRDIAACAFSGQYFQHISWRLRDAEQKFPLSWRRSFEKERLLWREAFAGLVYSSISCHRPVPLAFCDLSSGIMDLGGNPPHG